MQPSNHVRLSIIFYSHSNVRHSVHLMQPFQRSAFSTPYATFLSFVFQYTLILAIIKFGFKSV